MHAWLSPKVRRPKTQAGQMQGPTTASTLCSRASWGTAQVLAQQAGLLVALRFSRLIGQAPFGTTPLSKSPPTRRHFPQWIQPMALHLSLCNGFSQAKAWIQPWSLCLCNCNNHKKETLRPPRIQKWDVCVGLPQFPSAGLYQHTLNAGRLHIQTLPLPPEQKERDWLHWLHWLNPFHWLNE